MTKQEWLGRRFYNPYYWWQVERAAFALKSNGCSGVPDFYVRGCWEHDIHYRTGKDIYDNSLTRREADKYLRWYIWHRAKTLLSWNFRSWGNLGGLALAWTRWVGVRLLGRKAWKGEWV